MTTYTIIIPHKNTPDLLRRCLDSIPDREDIQVVVVDDDSNAESVDFANFPGAGRKHTEVYFTKESRGAGYARNVGLEKAGGKWVLFADADDFFTPVAFDAFDKYTDSPCDIVFFSTKSVRSDDTSKDAHRDFNNKRVDAYLDTPSTESEARLKYGFSEPWGKMIRGALISDRNIRFEETSVANDFWFSVNTAYAAGSVCADKTQVYTVTFREDSLSVAKPTLDKIKTRISVCNRVYSFFKANGLPVVRDDFRVGMRSLLWHKPVDFIRVCWALVKEDRRNLRNIAECFFAAKTRRI